MSDNFCVSRQSAEEFMRLFVNRLAYGIQATKPLPDGSVPYYLARHWPTKQLKALQPDVVRMHLNGDVTINLYAINPETQSCKWVAIDADFEAISSRNISRGLTIRFRFRPSSGVPLICVTPELQ